VDINTDFGHVFQVKFRLAVSNLVLKYWKRKNNDILGIHARQKRSILMKNENGQN
jgi:hypothetical protein